MPRPLRKLFSTKASPVEGTAEIEAGSSDTTTNFLRLPAEIRAKIYGEVICSAETNDDFGLADSFWNGSESTENGDCLDNVARTPNDQAMLAHNSTIAAGNVLDTDETVHDDFGGFKSFADILNLRLVCRQVTRELDYEIVQHTTSRVESTIGTVKKPLGYSSALQNIPSDPFWDEQPLLILDSEPKTYKDIQNLCITTYASDIHQSGSLGNDEQVFLESLAPHVRSLTLNMAVPEHVSAVSEQHACRVVGHAVEILTLHMFNAMCNTALQENRSKGDPLPLGGVVKVQICFPAGCSYARLGLRDYFVKVGGLMGLEMKMVKDEKCKIVGVVFALVGVDRLAKSRASKSKRVLGRVKSVWKKVTRGHLGR
ncbi:uncharacterized protein EKO05_0009924 [Ascochyta rabiei]|nr:uncharacterized protein EKO05_0009924 [Ascochyta rabiei]UPX19669.1 hypothetical protein EKO05_0009924 [Ascochyta rabiei]